jgi:hypothetical protein
MSPSDSAPDDRKLGWTALTLSVLGTVAALGLHHAGHILSLPATRPALLLFGLAQLAAIGIGRTARTEPAGKAGVVTGGSQLLLSLLLLG